MTSLVRGDTLEPPVRRADTAPYEPKRRGRNRIEPMAPPPPLEAVDASA